MKVFNDNMRIVGSYNNPEDGYYVEIEEWKYNNRVTEVHQAYSHDGKYLGPLPILGGLSKGE